MQKEITAIVRIGKKYEDEDNEFTVFLETKKGLALAVLYSGGYDQCEEYITNFKE